MATFKPRINNFIIKNFLYTLAVILCWHSKSSHVEGFMPGTVAVTGKNGGLIITKKQQTQKRLPSKLSMMVVDDNINSINMMMMVTTTIASAYTNSLVEHPLPTKSVTASILCGLGDFLAQKRDPSISEIDWDRLRRFAIKGLGGGVIWAFWYDTVDNVVDTSMMMINSAFSTTTTTSSSTIGASALPDFDSLASTANAATATATANSNNAKVAISILLEQFFCSPLIFGLWEIPVATLMNGGSLNSVPGEVKDKLGNLLIDNAKIWTPANIIIYSAPLEFRAVMGNLVDILWQSIVANMAADCGVEKKETKATDPGVAMVTQFLNTNSNNNDDNVVNEQLVQPVKVLRRRRRRSNRRKIPGIIEP